MFCAMAIGAICVEPLTAQTQQGTQQTTQQQTETSTQQAAPSATRPATTTLSVRPGERLVLDTASCVVAVDPPPGGAVEVARVSDTKFHAVYNAPQTETSLFAVVIETGTKPTADGKACEGAARKRFDISVSRAPEVPPGALEGAFRILMAAFVLAILLESAFALIFNWRLFHEFFVGKAWRTPIMFLGAFAVVRTFDLDLMEQLVRTYNPSAAAAADRDTGLTSVLSAMILAGGSVGVNRIMVALGFRSQIRPDADVPKLNETEAFVSIRVQGSSATTPYRVNMETVDSPPADTPTALGFVGSLNVRRRFTELLFPVRGRIPPSGGMRLSTAKAYRVSVTDLSTGKHYDTAGREIASPADSQLFRLAPRAIVDFTITPAPTDAAEPEVEPI